MSGPTVDLKGREAFVDLVERLKHIQMVDADGLGDGRWRVVVRRESARDREVEWHLAVLADLQSLFSEDRKDREKLEARIAQRFGVWFLRLDAAKGQRPPMKGDWQASSYIFDRRAAFIDRKRFTEKLRRLPRFDIEDAANAYYLQQTSRKGARRTHSNIALELGLSRLQVTRHCAAVWALLHAEGSTGVRGTPESKPRRTYESELRPTLLRVPRRKTRAAADAVPCKECQHLREILVSRRVDGVVRKIPERRCAKFEGTSAWNFTRWGFADESKSYGCSHLDRQLAAVTAPADHTFKQPNDRRSTEREETFAPAVNQWVLVLQYFEDHLIEQIEGPPPENI
jgi:hypothetical protein